MHNMEIRVTLFFKRQTHCFVIYENVRIKNGKFTDKIEKNYLNRILLHESALQTQKF